MWSLCYAQHPNVKDVACYPVVTNLQPKTKQNVETVIFVITIFESRIIFSDLFLC